MKNVLRRSWICMCVLATLVTAIAATEDSTDSSFADRQDLVSAIKHLERKLGFRRTKNFQKSSSESAVAYRCYYTGKLELPESYGGLHLETGTKDGCDLDTQKYDVFFYPMDANASGKTPLSASLAHESMERFLVVIPHEDFHANKELHGLPETWAEASATLIGFLTAQEVARRKFGETSEVYRNLQREPELFAQKAEVINRYYVQLKSLYAAFQAGQVSQIEALMQKQEAFDDLHQPCAAITPNPKSFNRCPAAMNNAGFAFDETYTKYYPAMYRLYLSKGSELKPTLDALQYALNTKSEAEALENLRKATKSAGNTD
jgi:hypothetical protein